MSRRKMSVPVEVSIQPPSEAVADKPQKLGARSASVAAGRGQGLKSRTSTKAIGQQEPAPGQAAATPLARKSSGPKQNDLTVPLARKSSTKQEESAKKPTRRSLGGSPSAGKRTVSKAIRRKTPSMAIGTTQWNDLREKIDDLKKEWEKTDPTHEGLTPHGFKKFCRDLNIELPPMQLNNIMTDGRGSFNEVIRDLIAHPKDTALEGIDFDDLVVEFNKYDTNSDGVIDGDDWAKLVADRGASRQQIEESLPTMIFAEFVDYKITGKLKNVKGLDGLRARFDQFYAANLALKQIPKCPDWVADLKATGIQILKHQAKIRGLVLESDNLEELLEKTDRSKGGDVASARSALRSAYSHESPRRDSTEFTVQASNISDQPTLVDESTYQEPEVFESAPTEPILEDPNEPDEPDEPDDKI